MAGASQPGAGALRYRRRQPVRHGDGGRAAKRTLRRLRIRRRPGAAQRRSAALPRGADHRALRARHARVSRKLAVTAAVTLVEPYNPEWATWFLELHALLGRILAGHFYAIEHVGSTSVPGMVAKPV